MNEIIIWKQYVDFSGPENIATMNYIFFLSFLHKNRYICYEKQQKY